MCKFYLRDEVRIYGLTKKSTKSLSKSLQNLFKSAQFQCFLSQLAHQILQVWIQDKY